MSWMPANQAPFTVSGLPWMHLNDGRYVRLPPRAEAASELVWRHAQWSAGGRIRFKTNSSSLYLRINHDGSSFPWPEMSSIAIAGIELYEGPPTAMTWRGVVKPESNTETYEAKLFKGWSKEVRDLTIYLPTYSRLSQLDLRLDEEVAIGPPSEFVVPKPIAFYGTSFVNGGCASRGSMSFPAMIGRLLGVDFVNLGFAGDGRCEPLIADCMSELDAACYVMGPILNNPELMNERYSAFVAALRKRRPSTPILLMTRLQTLGVTEPFAVNRLVEEVCDSMRDQGDQHIHLFDSFKLYGDGPFHPTVEGVHPTDLGFSIIADALAPVLRKVLGLATG